MRGGIVMHGSYPTIEAAVNAAWALEGIQKGQPIYIYSGDFASHVADALAPAVQKYLEGSA